MFSWVADKEIVYIYMLSGFSQKDENARVEAGKEKHEVSFYKLNLNPKKNWQGRKTMKTDRSTAKN